MAALRPGRQGGYAVWVSFFRRCWCVPRHCAGGLAIAVASTAAFAGGEAAASGTGGNATASDVGGEAIASEAGSRAAASDAGGEASTNETGNEATAGETAAKTAAGAAVLETSTSDGIPIRLSYAGTPDCNDRGRLVQEIWRRNREVVISDDPNAATAIEVRVANGTGRVDAVMIVQRQGSLPVTRAVTGISCDEVLEATALIIAVLMSEHAPAAAPPTPPPVAAPSPVSPPLPPSASPPPRPPRWRFGGGAAAWIATGIAPGWLPGAEAFLGLSREGRGWAPAFRAGLRQAWRSGVDAPDGTASFQLTAGTVSACPVGWAPSEQRVAIRPCLLASVGSLQATGARSERHPWWGAGAGARLEAKLHRAVSFEVQAGLELSGAKRRFLWNEEIFHEVAPATGWFGAGLVAHAP